MKKQFSIGSDNPFLRDHLVYGRGILPGLAYIDIAYQFFRDHGFAVDTLVLEKLRIFIPLRADERQSVRIEITAAETSAQHWVLRFQGLKERDDTLLYASAEMRACPPVRLDQHFEVQTFSASVSKRLALDDVYGRLSGRGLVHSGIMKVEGSVHVLGTAGIITISLSADQSVPADSFLFHPALVDGAAIAALAVLEEMDLVPMDQAADHRHGDLWLPLAYEAFHAVEAIASPCLVRVAADRVRAQGDILSFDLTFFNGQGAQIAELRQLTLKRVSGAIMIDPAGQTATVKPMPRRDADQKAPSHSVQAGDAEQLVIEVVAAVLGGAVGIIDHQAEFYDLGLQSAGLLQVVSVLEDRLGLRLSPTLLFEYTNPAALAQHLLQAHSDRFGRQDVQSFGGAGVAPDARRTNDSPEDIAIIGMAGRFPGAADLQAFWANLKAGVHSVTTVPESRWDWRAFEAIRSVSGRKLSKWGGFLDNVDCFDAPFFRIAPGEAEAMDPQERLFLETCWETIEDAGYTPESLAATAGPDQRRAVGVFVGVMHNDYGFLAAEANQFGHRQPISLSLAPIANRVSYSCDFHGPSLAVDTVCSASLTALHLALESLRKGESEVALAGGVNLSLHPNKYLSYGLEDMHASADACRSFGEGGDGYVSAEGVGAVLLKPLARAMADGDHIYAVVKASAVNHGGKANGMHVPSPVAQADVVQQCIAQSGIDARSISYLEAHGTGTSLGDPIELQGLSKAFSRSTADRQFCAIGSVKSNIGHAESAAGISGLLKTALQLHHRTLVPSLHSDPVNPYLDLENSPFYLQRETLPWQAPFLAGEIIPRRAGVSAFGATGSNAHVILEEFQQLPHDDVPVLDGPVMIVLSARNGERLRAVAERLHNHLEAVPTPTTQAAERHFLVNLSYTLQVGRRPFSKRLGFEAASLSETISLLRDFLAGTPVIRQLHRGRIEREKTSPPDKALVETLAQWVEQGEQARLLNAWVKGTTVDWVNLIWAGRKPRRLSLPTYPFARERYWIRGASVTVDPSPVLAAACKVNVIEEAAIIAAPPLAQVLRRMVATEMKIDPAKVRLDDGLFDQGLSSSGVVGLINALAQQLKITLSPALLFEHATIAALCDYLLATYPEQCADVESLEVVDHDVLLPRPIPTPRAEGPQIFSLTEAQKGLWALQKRAPGMSAYNVPLCFRLSGLDLPALEQSCHFLLRQHPILTAVIETSGATPRGVTRPNATLSFHRQDLSTLAQEQVRHVWAQAVKQPFNLEKGPLFKVFLFTLSKEESLLLFTVHHIIFDGHSISVLMETLLKAYAEFKSGGVAQPIPLSFVYGDFALLEAELLASAEGQRRLAYWQKKLAGPLPALALPPPRFRPQAEVFAGESYRSPLSRDLTRRIKAFCESRRLYPSTLLLGLFNIVLARHSGEEQVVVGMPVNQRGPGRFQDAVDFLINMLPILDRVDEAESLLHFLERLQKTMLDAMLHDYPFPAIARALADPASSATSPLFQAVFMFQDMLGAMHSLAPELSWMEEIRQEGEYELVLEVSEEKDQFVQCWKFQSACHDVAMIRLMAAQYAHLAEAVLSAPDLPLSSHSLLTPAEERQIHSDWNATAAIYATHETVDTLFLSQVAKTPHAIALVCGEQALTYGVLSSRVSAIAAHLQAAGAIPGACVALCVERSPDMVAGLLAILRANMTYVPLDPSFPADRLSYILADSRAAIVLTQTALSEKVRHLIDQRPDDGLPKVDVITLEQIETLIAPTAPASTCKSDDLAYIIYTSGSTGRPKGVMIPHRALTNFLLSMAHMPGMGHGDRLLAVTTYSFDIAGLELFLPLIVGGTCHIAETAVVQDAERLRNLIGRVRPTLMQATPSTWTMLFHAGWHNEECVRVLCGGEAMPETLRQRFHEADSEVWNLFGPTETTIWSTLKRLHPGDATTIGRPIANTEVLVLDDHHRLSAVGVPGELCIAGDGVAAGYWNLPMLTAEKFIDHPFDPGRKLYRTGDRARWTAQGEIDYLGRLDFQVKLNGFRIELGEIEKHLTDHPTIREAVVVLQERGEIARLAAFYLPAEGSSPERLPDDLGAFLRERLPAYMIPALFVAVAAMPLTPNGKIDRRSLMAREIMLDIPTPVYPETKDQDMHKSEPTLTKQALDNVLLEVWQSVFQLDGIQPNHSFVDLGGNSVSATILAERIANRIRCPFTVTDLFKYPSIAKISAYLGGLTAQEKADACVIPEATVVEEHEDNCADSNALPDDLADSLAIIGISCNFPGAKDHRQFWENLVQGRESVQFLNPQELGPQELEDATENRTWQTHPDYVPVQLNLEGKTGFDPDFFKLSKGNALLMDPQFRQLLMHAWKAVEDAGYKPDDVPNTGVFMSASNNFYQSLARRALQHAEIMEQAEDYVSWLLAQGGSIPTMVSYQLGLKGPSVFVHTNCSSSLTGLYFAHQALRSGDADCALVGAATLFSSFEAGYIHQPGLNFASDGHCKTFDARADGMIAGEGVCVIMVKRARDAIRDKDNIYCLVRGIGINNDGNDKAGFYAPSIQGQAAVIRQVLEKTGINPETIRYVEAHGTGTALGDPIEISALKEVYESHTSKRQFCGVGSVKPNIGHLDTAAGLAGCVKLALSLRHRRFPAEINYSAPNPRIDFETSPFFVQERESSWDDHDPPVRAALSSFGIGGSNAHAILEEYRPIQRERRRLTGAPQAIIPLSARNQDRLRAYASNLLSYLKGSHLSPPDLADLAYTMQVGRNAMDSRVAFVVESIDQLASSLTRFLAEDEDVACFEGRKVMDGTHSGLFEEDEEATDLVALWLRKGKLASLAKAWSRGLRVDWTQLPGADQRSRLALPSYPFAEERFHHRLSGKPAEKRIQTLLHPLVHCQDKSANGQGFTATFDGSEFFLAEHVLKGHKVLPGVAYLEMTRFAGETASGKRVAALHDVVWMQPVIVDQIRQTLAIKLHTEMDHTRFEVVSERPGTTPLVHSQGYVTDMPGSTTAHARIDLGVIRAGCRESLSSERFYDMLNDVGAAYGKSFQVIETLWKNDSEVLAKLVLPDHCVDDAGVYGLHPSIMDAAFQITDSLILQPEERGGFLPFFVKRVEVHRGTPRRGFAHVRFSKGEKRSGPVVRYDIDITDETGEVCVSIREFSARKLADSGFGLNAVAQAKATENKPGEMLYLTRRWMEKAAPTATMSGAETASRKQVVVLAGVKEDCVGTGTFPSEWHIIHLPPRYEGLEQTILSTFTACFDLVKTLFLDKQAATTDLLVIVPGGRESYAHAPLEGLFLTAAWEARKFKARLVTVELLESQPAAALHSLLQREMQDSSPEPHVRYTRDLKRLVKRSAEIALPAIGAASKLRENGVYWITGGSGRLARMLARDFARRQRVHIVLTGRSVPDAKRDAESFFENGSSITYWQADMTSGSEMQQVLDRIRREFGALNGIVHAAGVLRDTLIVNKTATEIEEVLAPKIKGLLILDEITRNEPIDFLALFASVSGVFGAIGQADYAGANAFLDAFAEHRNRLASEGKRHGRTVAIDWPLWSEGGMQVSAEQQAALFQANGVRPLSTTLGLEAFYRALAASESQIIVLEGDRQRLKESYLAQEEDPLPTVAASVAKNRSADLKIALRRQLRALAGEQVHRSPEELDEKTPFGDYGFDSISFTTFSNRLNTLFKLKAASADAIAPTVFFEYNTLVSLEAYLLADYGGVIASAFSEEVVSVDLPEGPVAVNEDLPRVQSPVRSMDGQGAEDIAIIGISCKFPMAEDLDSFWRNLLEGRDCITEVPPDYWDWKSIYGDPLTEPNKTNRKWGGFMQGAGEFDPMFFGVSPKDAVAIDPGHRLLFTHVWKAMEDAGYSSASLSGSNTSVFVGIGNSGYADLVDQSGNDIDSLTMIGSLSSMALGRVSHMLNLHGPSEPVDTACSASIVALYRGIESILSGRSDMSIVGGVQGMFSPKVHISFSKAGMLAEDGRCKTFSSQANGYVRGEGVGILVLKRLSSAVADKDHIYGVIKSCAVNHGGKGNSLTAPNPKAQKELLVTTFSQAGIDPRSLGYIEAHGTGTPLGDPIEVRSLKDAFAAMRTDAGTLYGDTGYCGLGSVKTNIGHLELAAGVAGIIKILLQMKHQTLVPSLHCKDINPHINLDDSPFHIVRNAQKWTRRVGTDGKEMPLRAGVSSFGLGGVNAHAVIEEYVAQDTSRKSEEDIPGPVMIVLSAKFSDRLKAYAEAILAFAERETAGVLANPSGLKRLAFTLQTGRDQMKHRLGFVVSSVEELKARLREALADWDAAKNMHGNEAASNQGADGADERAEDLAQILAKGDLDAILSQWLRGRVIDWQSLHTGTLLQKLPAPTYPFARERYWVTPKHPDHQATPTLARADPVKRSELEMLLDVLGTT
jgi:polyketide synthase PksJ